MPTKKTKKIGSKKFTAVKKKTVVKSTTKANKKVKKKSVLSRKSKVLTKTEKPAKKKNKSKAKKRASKKIVRKSKKTAVKSKKIITPKVRPKTKIIDEDLELRIFDDTKEDFETASESKFKQSDFIQESEITKTQSDDSNSVEVSVKSDRRQSPVPRNNVLDLKGNLKSTASPVSDSALLVEEIEENPGEIFKNILEGNISESKTYIKEAKLYHNILNLSFVAWLIYLGFAFYKFIYPALNILGRIFLFIANSFWEYLKTVYNFVKLAIHSFSGRVKFNKENFLYPEKAFLNLSLFDHKDDRSFISGPVFNFSPVTVKSISLFLAIAFVVILPIKGLALWNGIKDEQARVLGASETAYSSLQMAMDDIHSFSWLSASANFAASRDQFEDLYEEFQQNHSFLKKFLAFIPSVRQKVITAESMVSIGVDISLLGEELSRLLHLLQASDNPVTLTQKISAIRASIAKIENIKTRLDNSFASVTISALPDDIQDDVRLLKNNLPQLFSSLEQVDELLDFSYKVLGGDKQQRYLLVFQNSDELRPTGGFMGSLSIVDVYQGKILNSETPTGGPYDWQGWLKEKTLAPHPLWIVNPIWQFQDANWFFDFPTSASKILQFYHQTRPEMVDGVIAINSYVLPKILQLTGEIEMPDYNKVLNSDNVLLEIQKAVELEYDQKENQPKKIISDLFNVIQEKLSEMDSDKFIDFLNILSNSLQNKDIQMYFTNPELQAKVSAWNWSGEVRNVKGDYLAVVNTNIAGAKTDKFIIQNVELDSDIQANGDIINTLRIKRINDGIPGDVFYGHNNVDFLRVYVPLGSELIAAEGSFEPPEESFFDVPEENIPKDNLLSAIEKNSQFLDNGIKISSEFGKTVFAGWLQTNLGETSEIVFKYKLPFKTTEIKTESNNKFIVNFDKFLQLIGLNTNNKNKVWHSFYWQKQSGQHNNESIYKLRFPKTWQIDYLTRPGFTEPGIIEYQMPLERDFATGFLLGKE